MSSRRIIPLLLPLVFVPLPVSTAFADYLADITVSRTSPASLPNGWIVEVACDWQWDGGGHDVEASVKAIPLTGGVISPGAWVEDFNVPGAGSGRCWPNFTIQSGTVVVDEILLTLETSPPEYEVLLELRIPVELHFGPHAFYGITLDPPSPNRMQFNQFVEINFFWETDFLDGKRIVARPMTGEAYTPNMSVTGSAVIGGSSGAATRFFTVAFGEIPVDAIRFEIYNGDWSEFIYAFRLPVDYDFAATAIQNIALDPPFPASRIHNNNVAVDFDYRTDYPLDPVVTVTPYTDGAPTPGGEPGSTPPLAPGAGSGATTFDVLPEGGMVDVDALLFEMRDFFDPGVLIDSFMMPVYYHYADHAIRAVEYDPLPPAILGHGTSFDAVITWENGMGQDGWLEGIPRTWGADTPNADGYFRSISYDGYNPPKRHFYTVTAGNHLVDHLHFTAHNSAETDLWMTFFYPAWFQFGGPAALVPVPGDAIPAAPVLLGNYPNPFNPRTVIAFELPASAQASLRVYDVAGRLVRVLLDGEKLGEGRREVPWDGTDGAGRPLPAGVYFYRLESAGFTDTGRMALVD
jgi:hypothetical protein